MSIIEKTQAINLDGYGDDKWTWWDELKDNVSYWFPFKQIRDVRYYLRHRLVTKKHLIKTGLAKGCWWDTDSRMFYGLMSLLTEYIETERPFETINWDSDEWHINAKAEMLAIKEWWDNYENRCKEIEAALDKWHDTKFGAIDGDDWLEKINTKDTPEVKELFDHHSKLEEDLENETTEMMIRLVKIRGYLWT